MKKQLLAAVAVACTMAAGSALAGDGTIEASYINVNAGASADLYSLGASYNSTPAEGSWGVQVDGAFVDGDALADPFVAGQVTVFKRNSANLWGVYANVADSGAT